MNLEYLLSCSGYVADWAQTYAELEIYLNPGSLSGWTSHRPGISERFNPDYYIKTASLSRQRLDPLNFPWYRPVEEYLCLLSANPSPQMWQLLKQGADHGLGLVIHPDAQKKVPIKPEPREYIPAYLTGSTRTVLTATDNPVFLKLDYPGMIGRCPRRLEFPQLYQGTYFSNRFDKWSEAGLLAQQFGYLPETIGIAWKLDGGKAVVGMIGREAVPRPEMEPRGVYIPFFALLARDVSRPEDSSLLTQIIRYNTSAAVTPRDVFLHITSLIFRALQSLFDRQRTPENTGIDKYRIVHDAHSQNILLELDPASHPRRIIFRDFEHVYPVILDESDNIDYLEEANPYCKILDFRQDPEYVTRKISQLIDTKLGRYVIQQLLNDFTTNFDCKQDDLIADIRTQFRTSLRVIHEVLPKGVSYRRSDGVEYDEQGRIWLVQGSGSPLLRE